MDEVKQLRLKEYRNRKFFIDNPDYDTDYPHLDDPLFQSKISLKKEFGYKYDGSIKDIDIKLKESCIKNQDFELSPHQEFIKRFISYQTPYNGILLYHGLGSGKTCSAIGITETIREHSKYIHNFKKIVIIASPNVQENFKLQLFDPSKLKKINNAWNINGCLGNSLIDELNVYQIHSLSKEDLIHKINKLIHKYYRFTGYIEFANRIEDCIVVNKVINKRLTEKKLSSTFEGCLIVIDEIHNIRLNSDNKDDKKVANALYTLVQYVKYLKLVFLTGTPMYNDPKEIIYILNILNMNDNRSIVSVKEIFDKDGEFIIDDDGEEIGKNVFIMKANGYVSYVRGENPYTFPYLINPSMYNDAKSLKIIGGYPTRQFNKKQISRDDKVKHLDLYISSLSPLQEEGYDYFLSKITEKIDEEDFENMDSFKYSIVQAPIQALSIVYPTENGEFLTGNKGFDSVMTYSERQNPPSKNNFEYTRLDGMFAYDKIGEYSHKIKTILDNILNSDGIVLIYSAYINGGIIPIALALEELGFSRYGNKSKTLFKKSRNKPLNVYDLKRTGKNVEFKQACYSIICGEKPLSPNNNEEIDALTHNNTHGERVKVVIISQAGSEGIDLNNIRQVHIMEPWYNMNRIEQIIGRARRNCSHKDLPIEDRNVQVFLHCSKVTGNVESIDMYLYRLSEKKSIKIGKVSRVLKSISVDCILNKEQQNFAKLKDKLKIKLSIHINDKPVYIDFNIKDKAFTSLCDYNEFCEYECVNKELKGDDDSTYQYSYTKSNKVMDKIKKLFTYKHLYRKDELFSLLKINGINIEEIERALKDLETQTLVDSYGKRGNIINVLDLYIFQPIEMNDKQVQMLERVIPIKVKPKDFTIQLDVTENSKDNEIMKIIRDKYERALDEHQELKNEDDWYNFFNVGSEFLKQNGVDDDTLRMYLISHICEQLNFQDELLLLNTVYSKDGPLDNLIKEYYEQFIIRKDSTAVMLLIDIMNKTDKEVLYTLNDDFMWTPSTYSEIEEFNGDFKRKFKKPIKSVFNILGFMGMNKSSNTFEFKIKDIKETKFTGAIVENKSKPEICQIINTTIGQPEKFNKKNTSLKKKNELCVLEELLLRHYDKINKKGMRYFLNKVEFYYLNKN
jgi:superfamily II DNA or RNA helicase